MLSSIGEVKAGIKAAAVRRAQAIETLRLTNAERSTLQCATPMGERSARKEPDFTLQQDRRKQRFSVYVSKHHRKLADEPQLFCGLDKLVAIWARRLL